MIFKVKITACTYLKTSQLVRINYKGRNVLSFRQSCPQSFLICVLTACQSKRSPVNENEICDSTPDFFDN